MQQNLQFIMAELTTAVDSLGADITSLDHIVLSTRDDIYLASQTPDVRGYMYI